MTTDPNLIRCGNCGATWEDHEPCLHDENCGHAECDGRQFECGVRFCADDDEFAPETDADRQAAWASARGL